MADDNKEFKILVSSEADTTGFKETSKAMEEVREGTKAGVTGANELARAEKKESELAELLHHNHRALHQILHLIGREASPEAAAGLAAVSAAGGGGIMLAVMAVSELVEGLKQASEQAAKTAEAVRENFVNTSKDAETAAGKVREMTTAINDFKDALDRKLSDQDSKAGFAADLERIQQTAKAAEAAGLITKGQGAEFLRKRTNELRQNAINLDEQDAAGLEAQLNLLKAQAGGEGQKSLQETEELKRQLEELRGAFAKGEGFAANTPAGRVVLTDNALNDEKNAARRKETFENEQAKIEDAIRIREEDNRKLQEHIKVVEASISKFREDAQTERQTVSKERQGIAVDDFAAGRKIAQDYVQIGNVSGGDAQMLIVLEQAITGHKLTLEQASQLILLQTQNITVVQEILRQHQDQINAVHSTLLQLKAQGAAYPRTQG